MLWVEQKSCLAFCSTHFLFLTNIKQMNNCYWVLYGKIDNSLLFLIEGIIGIDRGESWIEKNKT